MQQTDLHIVTFSVPYPPHYGGVIDVWNRVKALSQAGMQISLHCFVYDAYHPMPEIQRWVKTVKYYSRVTRPVSFILGQPYIVTSRMNSELLKSFLEDNHPVLFEGLQSTGFVPAMKERKIFLRAHNVEHQYYAHLAQQVKGLKSLIYERESTCLKGYESDTVKKFDKVFAISPADASWFLQQGADTTYLPPFHGLKEVNIALGRGHYVLYQGDLSLETNQQAVQELVKMLPPSLNIPLHVAGRSGSSLFETKLASFPNLVREPDVSEERMIELIRHAHVTIIHSMHDSGMKLKIFPPLYHGRFIMANEAVKTNTSLDTLMDFYDKRDFRDVIHRLWKQEFMQDDLTRRKEVLLNQPDDRQKAEEIIRYL